MVALLKDRIYIHVSGGRRHANAFSITYVDSKPELAMQVTNALAEYFIDENIKVRESLATGTSDFLEAELESMRRRLEEKESALQSFREDHMGELPDQLQTNLRNLDRLQSALTERQEALRDARSQLSLLQNQEAAGLRNGRQAGPDVANGPDPLDIDALHSELARLEARYTDRHPDIIKIKKQIKDLEAKIAALPTEAPPQKRESIEVSEIRRNISNITTDINRIKSEIAYYERRVENTPKREQEVLALMRDNKDLQASYSSLLQRKLEADISVNMERKQKGEQFRILDRAQIPERPFKPDLQRLFLITIGGGMAFGLGAILLLELLIPGFRSPQEAESVLGLPTLAMIPCIESRRQRLLKLLNQASTGVALLATTASLVFFASLTFRGIEQTLLAFSSAKGLIF